MSYETIELPDGTEVGTGCLLPDSRRMAFAAYRDSGPMYTWEEADEILIDRDRVPRRKQFGPSWIYNQGQIGSCNGCAAALALERLRVIQGMDHVELSGEGVYAGINGGRDVGSMLDDGMKFVTEVGAPPRSMVKRMEFKKSRINPDAYKQAKRFRWIECYQTGDDAEAELELASGLAAGFVGVVAVHANNLFGKLDGDGVVISTDGPGNHAVGVDDVRKKDGEYQFDMFNSWGTSYGDQGRGWLSFARHFRTTKKYHAFYLARVAIDDATADNPY